MTKFGAVGVFGRANAGKSTLVNALVGERVSIVSKRPQTTRKRILGILTVDECQLVFCDTPGLHAIKNKLDAYMHDEILSTVKGLQAGLYLVDLSEPKPEEDQSYLAQLNPESGMPLFLVLNKSDLVDVVTIAKIRDQYAGFYKFEQVIVTAAARDKGHDEVLAALQQVVPEGPYAYDVDAYTSLSEREIVEETVREVALQRFYQEVPHSIAVQVEEFKERENGKTFVEATIYVEKESHKKIIVGKGGDGIKTLGQIARQRLNDLLGRDIFLQLWIKVRENWRRDEQWVERLGYRKST
ncbi:MAG: GTPase Era [Candidatus Riflebacteria bacterium HGW-Riflebacteria-1]|jgi:GTP-binding protein Era|nr:MAG: GTPase Era [Candidatus Riflebacteria bacterium HGW-Riflebacteria-1]